MCCNKEKQLILGLCGILMLIGCKSNKDPREVYSAQLHAGPVTAVAFSPDGNTLASASLDHLIRLLDVEGLQDIDGSSSISSAVMFEKDNSPLVSVEKGFQCLAFSPDGNELSACDFTYLQGGMIRRFDLTDDEAPDSSIDISFGGVRAAAYSPDGNYLVTGSGNDDSLGETKVFSTSENSEVSSFHETFGGIHDVAVSENSSEILSVSKYDEARIFNVDGEELGSLSKKSHHSAKAVFVPGTNRIITIGEDDLSISSSYRGLVHIWTQEGELIESISVSKLPLRALAVAPNGSAAAVAGDDMMVRVIRLDSFTVVSEMRGHMDAINDLSFTPDSRFIASGGDDYYLYIWNVTDLTGPTVEADAGDSEELSTDSDSDKGEDSALDTETDTYSDVDAGADTDTDTDTDSDVDTDADTDVDTDVDTDIDTDSDMDTDTDVDIDTNTEANTDSEMDGGTVDSGIDSGI